MIDADNVKEDTTTIWMESKASSSWSKCITLDV